MTREREERSLYARIVTSHWFHLAIAVLLVITSGWEIVEDFQEAAEAAESISPGSHHGLLLFALANILHRVAEMMEGVSMIHEVQGHGE